MGAKTRRAPAVPAWVANDALHLVLMPTERCDFRCTYCYEDFSHGRMSRETIAGIRKLLADRAPGLRSLTLEWFGGEPLLELCIVEEVQEYVQDLARRHPPLATSSGMTTNGYRLGGELLARLVALGVDRFQISLDGAAVDHDARRMRAGGGGTFQTILANLLAARDSDLAFRICVRIHVDRANRDRLPAFLELLAAELAGDDRFEVFVRPIERLGGPSDHALPILGAGRDETIRLLRLRARELGLRVYSPGSAPCYAAAANSFVVRASGELAKCTVALRHPNNRVGRLHADGTATIDDQRINGWVRGLFSSDPGELECPMRGFADRPRRGGGSPKGKTHSLGGTVPV